MARIGFVDNSGSLHSVVWTVANEGHDVLYLTMEEGDERNIGKGLVARASKLGEIVDWRPDVVVTYNAPTTVSRLARESIPTWGSSPATVELERDRMFANAVARRYGVGRTPRMYRFGSPKEAFRFLDTDKGRGGWVFKAEGSPSVSSTHPTDSEEELRAIIEYEAGAGAKAFVLQEKVEGLEISIEGWYDYRVGWLQPLNSTLERKKLMAGDNGPMTGCMGSVVWCWPGPRPKLFRQTLERLTPYLQEVRYVGPIDGNFILDYKTRQPNFLEFTPRFGWDAFEALATLDGGGLGEFFVQLGRGEARRALGGRGFGVAVRIYSPAAKDVPVWAPIERERRIYPKDLWRNEQLRLVGEEVSNGLACAFEATSSDSTVKQAAAEVYEDVISLITVPDVTYRNDIGEKAEEDVEMLEAWGYVVQREGGGSRGGAFVAVSVGIEDVPFIDQDAPAPADSGEGSDG